MAKPSKEALANSRFIFGIVGSICVGIQFGWPMGVATWCFIPLITSAIKRAGTESK